MRSVGSPLDSVLVKTRVLGDNGLSNGPKGRRGCQRTVVRRYRRLLALSGHMLMLAGLSRKRLRLRRRRIPLQPLLSSVVTGVSLGADGEMRFAAICRHYRVICTSTFYLHRILNGLLSGTVGCSRRRMGVSVVYRSRGNFYGVGIYSGKLNVPLGSRSLVFGHFRHSTTIKQDKENNTTNFNLNLGCMRRIVLTRNNEMRIRDRRKYFDRFALCFPVRAMWVCRA